MRKSRIFILSLVALALVANTMFAQATEAPASKGVVNINTADASQIALLPRIGEKVAARVVAYRKEHGPFKKATDVMQVKGIGDKTFELISPYLTLQGNTTLTTSVASPRKPRAPKAKATQPANAAH